MITVTILGSTGSIGMSTLDVIEGQGERFKVVALTANTNVDRLFEQCIKFQPTFAVMVDRNSANELRRRLLDTKAKTEVLAGSQAVIDIAQNDDSDCVVAAIVGAAGLLPTLSATQAGKRVLLANKEALVMSGELFIDVAINSGATLLPLDSEHNAIFQCMPEGYFCGVQPPGVHRLILTSSGGPFRDTPLSKLGSVTPEQACAHPNWSMGKKISVDSATMMNKGLEVIEAHWLFHVPAAHIEAVLHPQSIVHSMVDYVDGSMLAQMGVPDMRTPIAQALAWPERIASGVNNLDLIKMSPLEFMPISEQRYPCFRLAHAVLDAGGTAPAILNAANEVAVDAFLKELIGFQDIYKVIASVLDNAIVKSADDLSAILEADSWARNEATLLLA